MPIEIETHIDAPIETVFNAIADPDKRHEWMEGLGETIYPEGTDPSQPLNVKFKQVIKEGGRDSEYEGEVVGYEPPRWFVLEFGRGKYRMLSEYSLAVSPNGGTDLTHRATTLSSAWWVKLLERLFSAMTMNIMRKHMDKLKTVCEQGGAATPTEGD